MHPDRVFSRTNVKDCNNASETALFGYVTSPTVGQKWTEGRTR